MQMIRVLQVQLVLLLLPVLPGLLGLLGLVAPRVLLVLLVPGAAAAGRAGQRPRAWRRPAAGPLEPALRAIQGPPRGRPLELAPAPALVQALVPVVLIQSICATREALASTNTRVS